MIVAYAVSVLVVLVMFCLILKEEDNSIEAREFNIYTRAAPNMSLLIVVLSAVLWPAFIVFMYLESKR